MRSILLALFVAIGGPANPTIQPLPPIPPTITEAVAPLTELIGDAESDNVGGYNAANAGRAMDLGTNGLTKHFGRPSSAVTVGEILLAQSRGHLHAVGRYQVIGVTLKSLVDLRCITGSDTFNKITQDRVAVCLIKHKRPRVWQYLKTGTGLEKAANSVALEWASMPWSDGFSYYSGGDRAHATRAEVFTALKAVRRNAQAYPEVFE